MVKVMMYGCNGYMGHVICNLIKDMENVTVAAGIDPCPGLDKRVPVRGRKLTSENSIQCTTEICLDKRVPVRGRKLNFLIHFPIRIPTVFR